MSAGTPAKYLYGASSQHGDYVLRVSGNTVPFRTSREKSHKIASIAFYSLGHA